MFERMLSHPNIKIMLNADFREVSNILAYHEVIYSGPIDEFFDYRYGKLRTTSIRAAQGGWMAERRAPEGGRSREAGKV
jgi:UDP-galactopyranose mutase